MTKLRLYPNINILTDGMRFVISDSAGQTTDPANNSTFESLRNLIAALPLSGGTLTGALILNGDPTAPLQAATKEYVDNLNNDFMPISGGNFTGFVNGVSPTSLSYLANATSNIQQQLNTVDGKSGTWKVSARVVTTTNINLSAPGSTLNSVVMAANDAVLVAGQTLGQNNGVYIWNGAAVPMTRRSDCTTGGLAGNGILGMVIPIREGTYGQTFWMLQTDSPITVGTTVLVYQQTPAVVVYTANGGVKLVGNNFSIDDSYFSGAVTITAGNVVINPGYITNTMLAGPIISAYGGLGINTSSSSGFPEVVSGTWSIKTGAQVMADMGALALAGGTMTGALTLSANAVTNLQPVTLQQMNAALVGLWDDRGNYSASSNLFPSTGGSGTSGAVVKGDIWTISVAGTLGGVSVAPGDTVRALIDTPGQTSSNWAIGEGNFGYTPLSNVLNSANIFVGNGSNIAVGVVVTGDLTINNAGVTAIGNLKITSAMLQPAIPLTKIDSGTQTGTGDLVRKNSPSLITPFLDVATITSLNKITFTQPATGATITLADGSTFSTVGAFVTTFTFSAATSVTFPTAGTLATLSGTETLSNKTLTAPVLGTPASGTLTNCTGLPIGSGVSGLGTGIATFLAGPSSANLLAAVTDETGTGALVFAISPVLVTPTLGAASSTSETITGTAGAGFVELQSQSAAPAVGAINSVRLFSDASGRISWRRQTDTFVRTLDSTLTANRVYTLPDISGTFTLLGNSTTGSGNIVLATSATLVTPTIGAATATSISNANGTVSAPSYTFTSGTGNGFYVSGTNKIGVASNGIQVAEFNPFGFLIQNNIVAKKTVTTISGSATATGAQLFGGIISMTGGGGQTLTLDTAANIYAAMGSPGFVGASFRCLMVSTGGTNTTVATNTGLTLVLGAAAFNNTSRNYEFVVTNTSTPTITVYGG